MGLEEGEEGARGREREEKEGGREKDGKKGEGSQGGGRREVRSGEGGETNPLYTPCNILRLKSSLSIF